jgi:hypothetical protein
MSRFKKIVVISQFMKSRLVANGLAAAKIEVRPPVIGRAGSPMPAEANGGERSRRPTGLYQITGLCQIEVGIRG